MGDTRIRVLNLNPNDVNTAIMIDYQVGPGTVQQQAMNQFLTVTSVFISLGLAS